MTTKIHLVCTSVRYAFFFSLSSGNRHDAPQGRKLLDTICSENDQYLLMDRAYEDDKTRSLAVQNLECVHIKMASKIIARETTEE
ncbi:MAG: hypothetical protein K2H29_08395 [Oscillospiraceae bacterium]|nr:hypothetical protein [Oscillospiraceae bacterium]